MDDGLNIEGYELLEVIGRGGMGTVYKARQRQLERLVALKVVHGHLADDASFRTRFESEMKVAIKLEHPNLVPVLDAGESNGNLFMAFRLVHGRNLKEVLKTDGPMEPERAVKFIRQLADALEYVHDRGFLHRDVKPSNLILDEQNDHLYLADFGIAKAKEASQSITGSSALIGAIDYMAPEQFESQDLDERVDVYSQGCVLFELLTGVTPYEEDSVAALMRAKLEGEPRSILDLGLTVPLALEEVVSTALSRDPDDRYGTPGELAAAAEATLDGDVAMRSRRRRKPDSTSTETKTVLIAELNDETVALTGEKQINKPEEPPRPTWPRLAAVGLTGVLFLVAVGVGISKIDPGSKPDAPGSSTSRSRPASTEQEGSDTGTNENSPTNGSGSWMPVSTALVNVKIPEGWKQLRKDERNSGRLTSEWRSPDDPDVTVLIDSQSPSVGSSVMTSASGVRDSIRKSEGYTEIDLRPESIGRHEVARWEFEIPSEGQKVDYFLDDCNVSVAVLGTAPPNVFETYADTFREIVGSVEMNCQQLTTASPITTEGIDPIQVGMLKSEAEKAGDVRLRPVGPPLGNCQFQEPDAVRDVSFMFLDGRIARVDVENSDVSTLSGVSVGDTEEDVYAAYGSNIRKRPHYYLPENGSYLTFIPEDPSDRSRVIFDVVDGIVTLIRAGRLPAVQYVEGCA